MKLAEIMKHYVQTKDFSQAAKVECEQIFSENELSASYFAALTNTSNGDFYNLMRKIDEDPGTEKIRILAADNCFILVFRCWAYTFYFS